MEFRWIFVFNVGAYGEIVWFQHFFMIIWINVYICHMWMLYMYEIINRSMNYLVKWCKMWIWCDINFDLYCKIHKVDWSSKKWTVYQIGIKVSDFMHIWSPWLMGKEMIWIWIAMWTSGGYLCSTWELVWCQIILGLYTPG